MARAGLSMAFEELSGKAGSVVVVRQGGRQFVRAVASYRPPLTEAQQAAAARMARAAGLWRAMTLEQAEAWAAYGAGLRTRTGGRGVSGFSAFTGLAVRTMQADPFADVATWPPFDVFLGEDWSVSAEPLVGGVRFVAGGPCNVGVKVEVMVQKLKGPLRKAGRDYVSAGFVEFTRAGEGFILPLEPGTYVCATRFVKVMTGQATETVPCAGRFTVG